ncbi:MAG: hypothetical protein M1835_004300 [Candelina submexicana]|nr:MAG: hypothetical protein M1835_004300 [Candelina submexicana]
MSSEVAIPELTTRRCTQADTPIATEYSITSTVQQACMTQSSIQRIKVVVEEGCPKDIKCLRDPSAMRKLANDSQSTKPFWVDAKAASSEGNQDSSTRQMRDDATHPP